MTITFACPKCGREIRVRDEAAGKKGRCNGCQNSIVIPSPPLSGELITAERPIARRAPTTPSRRQAEEQFEVPAPRQQQAPPNIVVNVSQHAQATAIAGGGGYSNGWARAALLLAVLSLLICWIPFLGMMAFVGVGLAGLLCVIGFLAALFHGGRGLATTIVAVMVSIAASIGAAASTAHATAVAIKAAADAAEKNRAEQQQIKPPVARQVADAKPAVAAVVPVLANEAEEQKPQAEEPPAVPKVAERKPAKQRRRNVVVAEPSADQAAKHVTALLVNARHLARAGVYGAAEKKYRQVIAEAPGTPAAADAQKELDNLPAH